MALELRNAHSILAALRTRPGEVRQLILPRGRPSPVWEAIADLGRRHDVPSAVAEPPGDAPPPDRRRRSPPADAKQGREGAAHAIVEPRPPQALAALFAAAGTSEPEPPSDRKQPSDRRQRGVWLALDSVQDPRNVGAIFRSAAFFGVRGVVMAEDRAAPLTAVTYDTASGGLETVPFAVETNLRRALATAKDAGLWILGASDRAADSVAGVPHDREWLLVVGNEARGLRRLTLEACDTVCAIAPRVAPAGDAAPDDGWAGAPASLNVSVATGVMLAALTRPQSDR